MLLCLSYASEHIPYIGATRNSHARSEQESERAVCRKLDYLDVDLAHNRISVRDVFDKTFVSNSKSGFHLREQLVSYMFV